MQVLDLLKQCLLAYDSSTIVGGPDGRDGALVTILPSGDVVLAFRGTLVGDGLRSFLDWLNDLAATLVQADGFPGRVHEGFLRSLNDLWDGIISALVINGYKEGASPWDKKLWITGHSKGGALALLAGCRFAALKPAVITFASPMTGDLGFQVEYPQGVTVTRYEGKDDLVPWLPPFGYRSVGGLISQTSDDWKARHSHAHRLIADLLDPFTQLSTWDRVHKAHSLETGYVPWIDNVDLRSAA